MASLFLDGAATISFRIKARHWLFQESQAEQYNPNLPVRPGSQLWQTRMTINQHYKAGRMKEYKDVKDALLRILTTKPETSKKNAPTVLTLELRHRDIHLNPVFQLATRIPQSPASLDYFYWLIYTPRTNAVAPVWNLGERVSEYRRDDKIYLRILNLRFKVVITLLHELAVSTSNPIELNPEAVMRCDPTYFSITLFDSRFVVWIDANLKALQHAVSNARNQKYLANIEEGDALRDSTEPTGVVRAGVTRAGLE